MQGASKIDDVEFSIEVLTERRDVQAGRGEAVGRRDHYRRGGVGRDRP